MATLSIPTYSQTQNKIYATQQANIITEILLDNLAHPWALAFLPDGVQLISQRDGSLLRRTPNGHVHQVTGVMPVWAQGQGGLLDIAVDRNFTRNQTIYLSYAEPSSDGKRAGTAVARARLTNGYPPALRELRVIFRQSQKTDNGRHFGSRIVMAPDNTLFITVGERGARDRAQDPFDHAGSVIRIHPDGSVPADNPFADGNQALPAIWSIGHRNPQGALWHPHTDSLWTVSHGARGGDEINQPQAGKNYGWPTISYGRHYWGGRIGVGTDQPDLEQPLYYWDPSIAPSGFAFYDGDAFPHWQGDLFIGALAGQALVRLEVEAGRITDEERLFYREFGRIRDVRTGPDGFLYLLTDANPGALLRLKPAP